MSLASAWKGSSVAQVRLGLEEWEQLSRSMRTLGLRSTSDALREGIRLLRREAVEVEAARAVGDFYGGRPAPAPEGVPPVTQADLDAADASEW